MGDRKIEKSFKVETSGAHQICIQNKDVGAVEFELTVKSGDWSDDHAKAITAKHLRPVELQAYKVNEMIGQLRSELGSLVASEVQLSDQNESIRSRVLVFGCISIFVMAVSTLLQVKYLKNFFRYKKII